MDNNGSSMVLRIALFALGLVVLVLGLILLVPTPPAGTPAALFVSCVVIAVYVLAAWPFLLADVLEDKTGASVVSLGIYFKGLGAYAVLSAVLVVLAVATPVPLPVLVVVQLAGTFGLGLCAYSALVTSSQIRGVAQRQAAERSSLERLRSTSGQLVAQTSGLAHGDETQRELADAVQRIDEELRYLSPVHTPEAYALEDRIAQCLDALATLTATQDAGSASVREARSQALSAMTLIEQRKTMRY